MLTLDHDTLTRPHTQNRKSTRQVASPPVNPDDTTELPGSAPAEDEGGDGNGAPVEVRAVCAHALLGLGLGWSLDRI